MGNGEDRIILVVEDEDDHWDLIQRAYAWSGCTAKLQRVGSCRAALDFIEAHGTNIHLVLLDGMLPDGSGYALVSQIRGKVAAGAEIVGTSVNCKDESHVLDRLVSKEHLGQIAAVFSGLVRE